MSQNLNLDLGRRQLLGLGTSSLFKDHISIVGKVRECALVISGILYCDRSVVTLNNFVEI